MLNKAAGCAPRYWGLTSEVLFACSLNWVGAGVDKMMHASRRRVSCAQLGATQEITPDSNDVQPTGKGREEAWVIFLSLFRLAI
jgi:hypothetical protein